MRILVTGGAGFIGSHLCEKLLQHGHEVICVDNFISGSGKNIQDFRKNEKFRLVEHDITLPLKKDIGQIDQIYHLAAPACPVDFKEIPLQILWTAAAGTKNMLDLASKKNIPFLLASSSSVYDDFEQQNCNGGGKRFAENLVVNYYRHFRFPLKIGRIFETYGPRMRKHAGNLIADFIQWALMNEPLRIYGNDLQINNFCYIDDIVDGLILLMNSDDFPEPVDFEGSEMISLLELAKKIIEITGSSGIISQVESGETKSRLCPAGTVRNSQKLDFKPKIGLDEGLKKTVEYFVKY